jgi:isopenicillin N synthase-like dioxygenase
MASFSGAPFPDNVATATMPVIDFPSLVAGAPMEVEKLWDAATNQGFWYIKNYDVEEEVDTMFDMGRQMIQMSPEEKLSYGQAYGQVYGYKYADPALIRSDNNAPDLVEYISVAKDDALEYPQEVYRSYPSVIREHMTTAVAPFTRKMFPVATGLLQALNDRLGLPKTTISDMHEFEEHSSTESRVLRAGKNPILKADESTVGAHYDFSSLTILHHLSGGLQVLEPQSQTWKYIKPLPGHAICNLGYAMTILSGGILKAGLHRVVAPPGQQALHDRWALIFFLRPGNSKIIEPLSEQSSLIAEALKTAEEGVTKYIAEPKINAQDWYFGSIKGG